MGSDSKKAEEIEAQVGNSLQLVIIPYGIKSLTVPT